MGVSKGERVGQEPPALRNREMVKKWLGWEELAHNKIHMQETSALNPLKDITIAEEIAEYESRKSKGSKA